VNFFKRGGRKKGDAEFPGPERESRISVSPFISFEEKPMGQEKGGKARRMRAQLPSSLVLEGEKRRGRGVSPLLRREGKNYVPSPDRMGFFLSC